MSTAPAREIASPLVPDPKERVGDAYGRHAGPRLSRPPATRRPPLRGARCRAGHRPAGVARARHRSEPGSPASTRTRTSRPTSPARSTPCRCPGTPSTAPTWSASSTRPGGARRHRRRRRHHRHVALRRHHRDVGRGLELALRHRATPRVPRHAVRRPRDAGARRRHGLRRVGVGHHVRTPALGVRRGQGRADVAGAHRRGRAGSARASG